MSETNTSETAGAPGTATAAAPLTLQEAADRLGVHYMTAYRYVRTGRLAADKTDGVWAIDPEAIDQLISGPPTPPTPGRWRTDGPTQLRERLIRGDEAGAWTYIEQLLVSGARPDEIYTELISPALVDIGEGWAAGHLSVAQEHRASAVALRLLGRMGPKFAHRGRTRGTIMLAAPPGDAHSIPTSMMGDLLRSRGFEICDLGANTPAECIAEVAVEIDRLVAIGICMTTPDNEENTEAMIRAIRAANIRVPLVIGGSAVTSTDHGKTLGADIVTTSDSAVTDFERATGAP